MTSCLSLNCIPQQLREESEQLEARVAFLETELTQMKKILSGIFQEQEPWWLRGVGCFEDDPTFGEATRFGKEWRRGEVRGRLRVLSNARTLDEPVSAYQWME